MICLKNVSVSLDSDLKDRMDSLKFINWSEVAREAFEKKVSDLELLDKILAKSTLTEEDALDLGRKVNEGMMKRIQNRTK